MNIQGTKDKVKSFLSLPQGWNFGSGIPLLPELEEVTYKILDFAANLGYDSFGVFPGDNGEIEIYIYRDLKEVFISYEFVVDSEDKIFFVVDCSFDNKKSYKTVGMVENISLEESLSYFKEISGQEGLKG